MHRSAAMTALVIGALSLAGCAHSGARYAAAAPQTAPSQASGTPRTAAAAAPAASYTSPVRIVAGTMTATIYLRPAAEQGGDCQLFVSISRGGYWAGFYRVVDAAGRRYPVALLGQHMSCRGYQCSYLEDLRVGLSNEDLAHAAQKGLALRLEGQHDSYDLKLPARYVAQFTTGLRSAEMARAAGTRAAPVPASPAP